MLKWWQHGPGQYKAQVAHICELSVIHQPRINKWVAQVIVNQDSCLTTFGANKFDTLELAQQAAIHKAGRLLLAGLQELLESE